MKKKRKKNRCLCQGDLFGRTETDKDCVCVCFTPRTEKQHIAAFQGDAALFWSYLPIIGGQPLRLCVLCNKRNGKNHPHTASLSITSFISAGFVLLVVDKCLFYEAERLINPWQKHPAGSCGVCDWWQTVYFHTPPSTSFFCILTNEHRMYHEELSNKEKLNPYFRSTLTHLDFKQFFCGETLTVGVCLCWQVALIAHGIQQFGLKWRPARRG